MTRAHIALAAGVAVALTGCGDGGPKLVPVHGRVTLDGKPLVGKTVKFVPDAGTQGLGSGATTNAEGTYTLMCNRPGATKDTPGAVVGSYRVIVVEPMFPVDLEVQDSNSTTPVVAIGLPTVDKKKKQEIPAAYTQEGTTPLRVTVPDGGGALNLAVESPLKK